MQLGFVSSHYNGWLLAYRPSVALVAKAHLDLLDSASHASGFTASVFGTLSRGDIRTRWGRHYMLNMIMVDVRGWIVLRMGRKVLVRCRATTTD